MAKPSPEHELIIDALVVRLSQLFPDPLPTIKKGVEIPIGDTVRKPDLYVQHNDGRIWVFEAIHRNQSIQKIKTTHELYANAGIHDHWILWETLEPDHSPHPSPQRQRILPGMDWETRRYKLSGLHRTLLELQPEEPHFLYAFTADHLQGLAKMDTALGRLLDIGLRIYTFEDFSSDKRRVARETYLPLTDLDFGPDGTPRSPEESVESRIIERALELSGIDLTNPDINAADEILKDYAHSPEAQQRWMGVFLMAAYEQLSDAEQIELRNMPPDQLQLLSGFQSASNDIDTTEMFNDAEVMKRGGQEVRVFLDYLESQPFPEAFKKVFRWIIQSPQVFQHAFLLEWQANSLELEQVRTKRNNP